MIKIIKKDAEIKEYIFKVKKLFEAYKAYSKLDFADCGVNEDFVIMADKISTQAEELKGNIKYNILCEHILGDKPLAEIAEEEGYSVPYAYSVRSRIYKDFATILFGVIIL